MYDIFWLQKTVLLLLYGSQIETKTKCPNLFVLIVTRHMIGKRDKFFV